jgi:hypothetical protein
MAGFPRERAGLLILRARVEGPDQRLMVRVMHTLDITEESMKRHTTSSIEDTCALIREWLEAFLQHGRA